MGEEWDTFFSQIFNKWGPVNEGRPRQVSLEMPTEPWANKAGQQQTAATFRPFLGLDLCHLESERDYFEI